MPCSYDFSQFSVTGDCENNGSGGFTLYLSSTSEPMSITWILPNPWTPYGGETTETGILNGARDYSNIPAGTYVFVVNDSCGSPGETTENNRETINITVSSGTSCVNIGQVVDTTCGLDNGSLVATIENINGTANYYLYRNELPYLNVDSSLTEYTFDGLPSGVYYVIAEDGGGCTGKSESCIVNQSVQVQFGTYIVDDADCGNTATGVGKIFITGLTGTSPYTYRWEGVGDNAQYLVDTGQSLSGVSITGLTAGFYSVTVTDSVGCFNTVTSEVTEKPPVKIALAEGQPPTCFNSNGSILINLIDGTPPYRYSIPSISFTDISYSQTYTFENLPGGSYQIIITDAALCTTQTSVQINQSNSFAIGTINITQPTCGNSNGIFAITLIGNTNGISYDYTLSGANGTILNRVGGLSQTFTNLSSQNYSLTITDGICTYTNTYNLQTLSLYNLTIDVTGTTCGNNNGVVTVTKASGGTGPFIFSIVDIDGNNNQASPQILFSSYTFSNLAPGTYFATVEDKNLCEETSSFVINSSENVNFTLIPQDSTNGSNGEIVANIYQGLPPFTLTWSSNVNGQTGNTVTNLSAGTYTLTVTDFAGCVLSNSVTLQGTFLASNFSLFNVCDSVIASTGEIIERDMSKMLVEGYLDLTSGCTNCLMNSAIFSAVTTVAGTGYSQSFYTATTLNDVPTETQWSNTVKNLLSGATGIGTVTVNISENTITVDTSCEESNNGLANQNITVQLKIVYDIDCESC
jgi:hypothetical protein